MKALRITSKKNGFRRAGIAHPTKPAIHPIKRFTPDQIEQLKNEPMLDVSEVDVDPKSVPAREAAGGGDNPASAQADPGPAAEGSGKAEETNDGGGKDNPDAGGEKVDPDADNADKNAGGKKGGKTGRKK
ncbi:MAG: HI1506-related protein [Rhodospirillales bacterium]